MLVRLKAATKHKKNSYIEPVDYFVWRFAPPNFFSSLENCKFSFPVFWIQNMQI